MSGTAKTPPAAGAGTPPADAQSQTSTPPADETQAQANDQGTPGDQATPAPVQHPEKTIDDVDEVVVEIGAKYKMVDNEPEVVEAAKTGVYTRAWWESLYRDEKGKTVQFKTTLKGYPVWNSDRTSYEIGPLVKAGK